MYILDKLNEQVSKYPNKIILVRDESLTYSEFDRRTNRLAQKLILKGCTPDTIVALQRRDSFEFALNFYAIIKASCRCAVINSDMQHSIVRDTMRENNIKKYLGDLEDIEGKIVVCEPENNLSSIAIPEQEQQFPIICFTSGTTGKPKPIDINMLLSENFINYLGDLGKKYDVKSFLFVSSNSFITGINNLIWAVSFGITTYFLKNETQNKNIFKILDTIRLYSIEGIMCPTAIVKLMSGSKNIIERLPSSFKFAFFGGESIAFSAEAIAFFRMRAITFINCYGMTEIVGATTHIVDWSKIKPDIPLPAGKHIPNVEVRLLHPENESENGMGIVSIRLYKNDRIQTDWFISADCATIDGDGTIKVLGRKDDCCKVRGYFVSLFGIEWAICGISYVEDAAVVAIPDKHGIMQICVAVVMKEDIETLRADLSNLIPVYMIPTRYIIVNTIPYNKSFKKDKCTVKGLFYDKN